MRDADLQSATERTCGSEAVVGIVGTGDCHGGSVRAHNIIILIRRSGNAVRKWQRSTLDLWKTNLPAWTKPEVGARERRRP